MLRRAAFVCCFVGRRGDGPDRRTGEVAKRSHPDRPRGLELRFRGAPARTGWIRRHARGNPGSGETNARASIARLVRFEGTDISQLPPFEHSGIHDPGLEPFPPTRPAVTDLAKEKGEALGIKVKPTGNRRLQPVVDEFFYWLRASVSKPIACPIGGRTGC